MSDSDPCGTLKNLFVPLAGRVYASRHFAHIVYDELALDIFEQIDPAEDWLDELSEIDLLTSATEAYYCDQYIRKFLDLHYDGLVVDLNCGLDTLADRNDNGHANFIEIDKKEVIGLRDKYIYEDERESSIVASIFDDQWIEKVIVEAKDRSVLIVAMNVFQNYAYDDVMVLLRKLWTIPKVSILFDVEDSPREDGCFYTDDVETFLSNLASFQLIEKKDFFEEIEDRKGMKARTKIAMSLSEHNHSRQVLYCNLF